VYWNIYGRAADLSGDIETVVNDGDFVLPFHVSADNQWLCTARAPPRDREADGQAA
jgi:hypothetical protein